MKKIRFILNSFFSLALFSISLTVAWGLYEHKNMWFAIVVYWVTLTVKNAVDCIYVWSGKS